MSKRKAYRPRAVMTNPLAALRPVSEQRRQRTLAIFWSALDGMTTGSNPGAEEWRLLSDCINTIECMALSLKKIAPDDVMPDIVASVGAMVRAKNRFQAGKGMRLDADGIQVIRRVIDYYAQCLEGLTEREMCVAQAETQRRVNMLLRSKVQRAEVISL